MNQVATFEKVSFDQFLKDYRARAGSSGIDENFVRQIWEGIKLPTRATAGSAGYDFYLPAKKVFDTSPTNVLTGIRCKIEEGWVLMLFPRSGLGFKYGLRLRNTAGIIDSDYYGAENEGHIQASILVEKALLMESGDRFMQGIFVPFGIATDGNLEEVRTGGFGSTDA